MSGNFSYNETDRMDDPGFVAQEKEFYRKRGFPQNFRDWSQDDHERAEDYHDEYWNMATRYFGSRCNGSHNGYAGVWS